MMRITNPHSQLLLILSVTFLTKSALAQMPAPRLQGTNDSFRLSVESIAVSPDNRFAVAAGSDGVLKMFRGPTWDQHLDFQRAGRSCSWVDLSYDGKYEVSTSQDDLLIWDVETRSRRMAVKPAGRPYQVHAHPSQPWCFCHGMGGVISTFSIPDGKLIRKINTDYDEITAGCFVADGSRLLISGVKNGQSVIEQRAEMGQMLMKQFDPVDNRWERLATDAQFRYVIAGGSKGAFYVWVMHLGRLKYSQGPDGSAIRDLESSPDGRWMWMTKEGKPVQAFDLRRNEMMTPGGDAIGLRSIEIVLGKNIMLGGARKAGGEAAYQIFQLAQPAESMSYREQMALQESEAQPAYRIPKPRLKSSDKSLRWGVESIALSHDKSFAVVGGRDGILKSFSAPYWKNATDFQEKTDRISWIDISHDDRYVLSTSRNDIILWDSRTRQKRKTMKPEGRPYQVHTHPSESWCFSTGGSGVISVFDTPGGRLRRKIKTDHDEIVASCFVGDGSQILISGFKQGSSVIELRHAEHGDVIRRFGPVEKRWERVATDNGLRFVVAGGAKGAFYVWSITDGEQLVFSHDEGASGIRDLALSPDGRLMWLARVGGPTQVYDFVSNSLFTPGEAANALRSLEIVSRPNVVPREHILLGGSRLAAAGTAFRVFGLNPRQDSISAPAAPQTTAFAASEVPDRTNPQMLADIESERTIHATPEMLGGAEAESETTHRHEPEMTGSFFEGEIAPGKIRVPEHQVQRDLQQQIFASVSFNTVRPPRGAEAVKIAKRVWAMAGSQQSTDYRYVCLMLTAKIAASGGDAQLAKQAIQAIDKTWDVKSLRQASEMFRISMRNRLPHATQTTWRDWAIETYQSALDQHEYSDAIPIGKQAIEMCQRSASTKMASEIAVVVEKLNFVASAYHGLKHNPSDPELRETYGIFKSHRGEWKQGIRFLTAAKNQAIADVAKVDLSSPTNSDDRKSLAMKMGDDREITIRSNDQRRRRGQRKILVHIGPKRAIRFGQGRHSKGNALSAQNHLGSYRLILLSRLFRVPVPGKL